MRREGRSAGIEKERVKRLLLAQFRFFDGRPDLLILFHQVRGMLKLQVPEGVRFKRSTPGTSGSLSRSLEPH